MDVTGSRSLLIATAFCLSSATGAWAENTPAEGDQAIPRDTSAFDRPIPGLDAEQLQQHLDGKKIFETLLVDAPDGRGALPPLLPEGVERGLGPLFNNVSCDSCHLRNGRGLAIAGHGKLRSHVILKVGRLDGAAEFPGGPAPDPRWGLQIQDHAVQGRSPEATIDLRYRPARQGLFADGTPFRLLKPEIAITPLSEAASIPLSNLVISPRLPQPVIGMGLLEAVPAESLVALADPGDADGDSVSGRLNRVWDMRNGRRAIGRFGWKAEQPSVEQQSAEAYFEDMGVTNPLFPGEEGTIELTETGLALVTFFLRTLAAPAPESNPGTAVRQGRELFRSLGCAACHRPELRTGAHPIQALAHKTIRPFTDLLLHDMGEGLADRRGGFEATGREWRTPPLWGLGLTQRLTPGARFLHDGRARTLSEAILWHGGEGDAARRGFLALPTSQRLALIAFLRSL